MSGTSRGLAVGRDGDLKALEHLLTRAGDNLEMGESLILQQESLQQVSKRALMHVS